MSRQSELYKFLQNDYEYERPLSLGVASRPLGALMSREELGALTGTMQPKRMCAWLEARSWAHEPPARRGDIPKVLRAYRDARLSGLQPERMKKANYSFMTAGLL